VLFARSGTGAGFVLFTTGPLDQPYVRFIERKLRDQFGFEGTPLSMSVRR